MNISKVAAIVSCALVLEAGADQEFFCDAVNGNDDWDGTSATYVSGTVGPKKTIGAAVNLADGTPTVITALPGVYDEGELTDDNGGKARVVITQRNLLIRSTEGKEKTFISGRHASTANGLGDDAVRCVFIRKDRTPAFASADQEATNTVIRGFTLCNGATPSGGAGAGVFCATPDPGGAAMLVDCTVSNCVGNVQVALSRCNAYRTLFVDNASVGSGNSAACMGFGVAVNCVMAFNRGSSLTYNMRKTQNCTFAFNEGAVFCGGWTVSANNCLAFGNGDNAGAGGNGYVALKYSVMAEPSSLMAGRGSLDANTITNAGLYQCLSPATGDWRLLAGSPAIGRGLGSYLKDVILPPGETMKDFYGNPIDMSGAVDCGAVQTPAATPAGGRLAFQTSFGEETRFQIGNAPAFGWRNAYHYGTAWPETCRVRCLTASPAAPLYKIYWQDGAKEVARRPGYDGYLNIVPPASGDAEQALRAVIAKKAYYVNRATGNDAWDGLSPTHVDDTTTGPKRTIQSACDNCGNYAVIYVAPGVYDEGMREKQESGYFSTNRVYIGYNGTCLVASDGPGTAVIKGAPDPVTGGIGQGAVRCLWVNSSECFVQGIDLVDGYTADTSDSACRGGASYMGNGGNCVLSDCMVSNCWAKQMPCMFFGNAERVRFVDCHSEGADIFRYATLYACEVSGMSFPNGGGTLFGSSSLYGCTVDLAGNSAGLSSGLGGCYFYGTAVRTSGGYDLSSNGGAANLVAADPGFANAAVRDYRLHALSPALGLADLETYSTANAKFTDSPTPRLRLLGDVAGRPLRFADNAFDAGANQATPVAAYSLTLQGDPQDVILTGGAWGTHGVTEAKDVTVTVKVGRRPFVGIEVNGEMLPPGTSSYAFQVSPDMTASPAVRVLFGSTWYVDGENGSDANGGGSLANALKHIRAATTNAVSGDVVLVAPGVYGEEEGAQYQTEKLDGDDSAPFNIGSRVFVPAGVTVKSLEGAAKTFIVGKASTGDYGLGSDAVRCVKLNGSGSFISGFTITGGRTDDGANNGRADFNAGGVLGPGVAVDCVISNNAAGRCGAGFKLTAVRCRIVDNIAKARASVGRESGFYSCYVDRNRSPEQAIQYHNTCCNTTFGPDNRNLSGGTQTAIVNVNSGGQMYNCVLNCYIGNYGSEEKRFFNCVFNKDLSYPSESRRDDSCILASSEELAFVDGRPVVGRNVCVDAGDATLEHGYYWENIDVDGKPRVQNAQMDIGACEADWKPVYARNLGGRRLTTVSAPADAQSEAAPHSPLHLPAGTVTFRLNATGVENADAEIDFAVTGGGTLTLVLGGETYGTYTAGTQGLRIPLSETVTELAFTYEPGAEVAGEAVISRVRIPKGAVLIVR